MVQAAVHCNAVKLALCIRRKSQNAGCDLCYLSDFVCEKVDGDKEACFDCRFIIAGVPREVVCNGIQLAGRVVKSHIAPTVIAACIGKKPFAAPVGGVDTVKIPVFGKTVNISVYICAAVHVRIVIERIFLNLFLGHGGGIVCREGNPGIGQRIVIVKHAIAVQTPRTQSLFGHGAALCSKNGNNGECHNRREQQGKELFNRFHAITSVKIELKQERITRFSQNRFVCTIFCEKQ